MEFTISFSKSNVSFLQRFVIAKQVINLREKCIAACSVCVCVGGGGSEDSE